MTSGSERKVDTRLVVRLPIACMYEAHGHLTGYQNADGGISVKPCDYCLNIARAEGVVASNEDWVRRIGEAIGADGA